MSTNTAYGSDVETAWADYEDHLKNSATPLPRSKDDVAFWPTVRAINEARYDGAPMAYLTRATVDIEPDLGVYGPVFQPGDLGYRLSAIATKIGTAILVEVMHENDGSTTEGKVVSGSRGPLPFVTTKAWVVPPLADSDAESLIAEISAAYNDLCRHGDRAYIQSPEQQDRRQAEQDDAELAAAGLSGLFGFGTTNDPLPHGTTVAADVF